ncbi:MAG: HAD-IIIA family hydrolase [Chroococcales cyanobacterium]
MTKKRILLVDCDGTIRNPTKRNKYINKPHQQKVIEKSVEAIAYFANKNITIIGITNQAGVASKHKSLQDCIEEQRYTLELIPQIQGIHFCPDFEGNECWYVTQEETTNVSHYKNGKYRGQYRKPNPGMLQLAADQEGVSIQECVMIGDRLPDQKAAENARMQYFDVKEWWGKYSEIAELF